MLLNTLPDKVKEFIKINLSSLNKNSFYYKKTKNGDKINAIYKIDEDLVYTDSKSLIYLMFKRAIFITKGEVYNNSFDPKIEEIYKLMASLITKKELINIINYNFKLRFDSDKNLDYRYLDKCELWQKIALMKANSDLVIKYICRDSYKKLLFTLKLKELLKNMDCTLYKYAVIGDNDEINKYSEIMNDAQFKILDNESNYIFYKDVNPIKITGLTNLDNVSKAISIDDNLDTTFNLVITHYPDYFETLKNDDIDVMLAGHSLNGLVVLPFYGGIISTDWSKKYKYGSYEENNSKLFISGGIGTPKIEFRLFNKPEINLYSLQKK